MALYNESTGNPAYSTTVGSSGSFSFGSVSSGTYLLKGAKSGYSILPQEVTITSGGYTIPDVLAYKYISADDVDVIVCWKNTAATLTSTLAFGNALYAATPTYETYTGTTSGPATWALISGSSSQYVTHGNVEYEYSASTYAYGGSATTGTNYEIFHLVSNPFVSYQGYIRCYASSDISLTGDTESNAASSLVTVYAMQGGIGCAFRLPLDSAESTIGVAQVAVTYPSSVTTYDIGSFGNTQFTNGIRSIAAPVTVTTVRPALFTSAR